METFKSEKLKGKLKFDQDELVKKKAYISNEIQELQKFVDSEDFLKIDPVQITLINVQMNAMITYSQILLERLCRNDID